MIIVRIAEGIADHFPARASEWALSAILARFGQILLRPGDIFSGSVAWAPLAQWGSEPTWGVVCIVIGGVRLVALIINGTFADFRYSPHVRGVLAFLSCFVWAQISIGLWLSGVDTTGLAVYPVLLALEGWNVWRAFGDAREYDRGAINARPDA